MVMPGRNYSVVGAKDYRFGFNGKENDNDVKGEGNQQDYGMRIYDSRLGRFLSVDPLRDEYPDLTTYQFASNTPIWAIDIDGAEGMIAMPSEKTAKMNTVAAQEIKDFVVERHAQGMRNITIAEYARQTAIRQGRVNGDGINGRIKALVYAGAWLGYANQFAPGFSDVQDAKDVKENFKNGKYLSASASLFFLVPGTDLFKLTRFIPTKTLEWAGKIFKSSDEFYKYSNKLDIGERIALYKTKAEEIARNNKWEFNETLSKKNKNRQIYTGEDGSNYSLDTQHGRFEVTNKKGKHQGEIDFFGSKTKDADDSKKHDLITK